MAAKKPEKEVIQKQSRAVEFQCSKEIKLMRGMMTKAQFKIMINNEREFKLTKKAKA